MKHTIEQRRWAITQLAFGEVLRALDEEFGKAGIRYMPIKGAYLLCTGLAEKIQERRMDDIDILVPPGDFSAARALFSNRPDCLEVKNYWPFEHSFVYSVGTIRAFVEIHSQLNFPERFELPTEALFERALPAEGPRRLPCPVDALLITICHALVHISKELRASVGDEIRLISSLDGFSWESFWAAAGKAGVHRFSLLVLTYFGEANHSCPGRLSAGDRIALFALRHRRVPGLARRLVLELRYVRRPVKLAVGGLIRKGSGRRPHE